MEKNIVKKQKGQGVDKKKDSFSVNVYNQLLEEKYFRTVLANHVAPLCKDMRENEGLFTFISDREFSTVGGKFNMQCEKISKRVSRQCRAIRNLTEIFEPFKKMPISESAQKNIYFMLNTVKDYAIEFGYCDEAAELLKVITDPDIVGEELADGNSKDDILKILNAYGKRVILEENKEAIKDSFSVNVYNQLLEEKYFKTVFANHVAPLCKDMKENEGLFTFISDREFSTVGGKLNMQCEKISKRVSRQCRAIRNLTEIFEPFKKMPISESAQKNIYFMLNTVKDYAIEFGYCDEAAELLKVITDPDIVGEELADGNSKDDILKILNAYGKRAILEKNKEEIKDSVDQLITDVVCGYYGDVAQKSLSQQEMDDCYKETTVVKGNMVFKMDGTHECKSKNKE